MVTEEVEGVEMELEFAEAHDSGKYGTVKFRDPTGQSHTIKTEKKDGRWWTWRYWNEAISPVDFSPMRLAPDWVSKHLN